MVSWTRLLAAALWAVYLAALATHPGGTAVATAGIRHGALAAAAVLAAIALLAARGGVDRRRPPWPAGWSFAIAGVPLLLLLRAAPRPLDHTSALGRTAAATVPAPSVPAPLADGDEVRLDRVAGAVGRTVTVVGMAVRPSGRMSYLLPLTRERVPEPMVLLRFRMICCAADSVPIAVQAAGLPREEMADGTWISATCTVELLGGEPLLRIAAWHEVPEPREPYLQGAQPLAQ